MNARSGKKDAKCGKMDARYSVYNDVPKGKWTIGLHAGMQITITQY